MKRFDYLVIFSWILAGIAIYYILQDKDIKSVKSNEIKVEESKEKRRIFFDWPWDADKFSYLNYKSLESFLVHRYGMNTAVEVILVADIVAESYKVKHLLR